MLAGISQATSQALTNVAHREISPNRSLRLPHPRPLLPFATVPGFITLVAPKRITRPIYINHAGSVIIIRSNNSPSDSDVPLVKLRGET